MKLLLIGLAFVVVLVVLFFLYSPKRGRILCSVTTIPQRYNLLTKSIESLQKQTVRPDVIYVHVAPETIKKSKQNIEELKQLVSKFPNVFVNVISEDLGPITKVVPVIPFVQKGDKVVLVDDDVVYQPDMIEGLKRTGKPAVGYAGRASGLEYVDCTMIQEPVGVDFLETFAGAMYDGKVLLGLAEYNSSLGDVCMMQDDVKIGKFLDNKRVPRVVIPSKNMCTHDAGDTPELRDVNLEDGNSKCYNELY